MALKRGLSSSGANKNRSGGGGSSLPILLVIFFCVLSPLIFFVGRGLNITSSPADQNNDNDNAVGSGKQQLDWRERLALQHVKPLFSKEVIDVITSSTADLGPLSLDSFRKNKLSASWKVIGGETLVDNKAASETNQTATVVKQEASKGKGDNISEDNSQSGDTPAKLARRQLREKRREKRVAELLQQDDEATARLENAAIERSKSVDGTVLGKYSIWRKEMDSENSDSTVRIMRDQMIMARVYLSIAKMKNKHDLLLELQTQLKGSQRALGDSSADSDLHPSAPGKLKAMGQVLSKAREQLYDCKLVTGKLRAMLQTADEQVRSLKKQSTFLSQLAAKTVPNGIHCLSMRLTIDYYLLPLEKRKFPRSENLENPNLFHYALFSDNVLAASVVVNSTIMNAKDSSKHVFHLVTDKLNFGAMNMWFLLNPPGKATIHVENVDEFKWLNSSYCPVLRQLESAAMKEYYFKANHPTSLSSGSSNLKYRNPKYLSMLNHLRFYLPQVYPKLDKILFLDDDIVVQKDLTKLWSVDLNGKVNGAVETCGESFHRFDKYLNFSNPHIARHFDPSACGWAYGMNVFDLNFSLPLSRVSYSKNSIFSRFLFFHSLPPSQTLNFTMNLTEGAISKITSGGATSAELKPTLQVTDLKQVQTKQPQQSDRFRLVLSDGSHLQQAMLGTQINHLVKDGNLRIGSIVQLNQYTCTTVQGRMIIIILELALVAEGCELIGNPVSAQKSSGPSPSQGAQPGNVNAGPKSFTGGVVGNQNISAAPVQSPEINQFHNTLPSSNFGTGRFAPTNAPFNPKVEAAAGSVPSSGLYANQNAGYLNPKPETAQPHMGSYSRPPQSAYQQPPPMYSNRGPVAKNEAPPRIVPITALNPYQGRWTIKARVTAKGELRHYNNTRGDGKVFSFDLLDSDGGEIRVTCFNQVADQFYHQIEAGRVYLISKGNLKPAQKNFNHLRHDLEIFLESTSTIQPCFEDDNTIPQVQFHFRPISDVEDMENNSVVDIIGVVTSITPTTSLMRKNGTETQKRTLQLKDMSGRSVELTLWGNFCNSEGQRLQHICDSGGFPVLAVKSGRVSEFNGKAVGTISTSQLFIEPDSPEASRLKEWFDREGRNTSSLSISRETSSLGRSDVMKTISQIKDERLGTSEKPDWITVPATVIYVKSDNFCYTACPIMSGERQCNKKVTNNGDGKWQCEKCDRSVDECDYRYILQLQIQDHTGITWVTAFQECGEEIMGISAKDLHYLKHEQQDDEGFSKVLRQVLFSRYVFKLKIKEETFSDEQRVKSTVVKSEKVNYSSQSRLLLDMMEKFKSGNDTSFACKAKSSYHNPGVNNAVIGNFGSRQAGPPGSNPVGSSSYAGNVGLPANQLGQYGNQQNPMFPMQSSSGAYLSCNSCGATGHSSANCPSVMNAPGQSMGGSYANRTSQGGNGECYKCHQVGHWARDCPGLSSSGRMGGVSKQQVGGF